jgi:hypothetical protein
MQFSSKLVVLLTAAAAGVFASPAVDANSVASSQTVQEGEFLYVGTDEVSSHHPGCPLVTGTHSDTSLLSQSVVERRAEGIEKRCTGAWKTPHADCQPGKCECLGNYGCWSCSGGRMQCQPGPGSGVCWT